MAADLQVLIAQTQEQLQPLIARPKLTDKLLSKPPFRFLHDIVSGIIKSTGFAEGLFNEQELDSANVQEKQQKLDFLDKIIRCVGICLGSPIDVRSVKIVAGLEPENTNLFLQALARASSTQTYDWAGSVQQTLQGDEPGVRLKDRRDSRGSIAGHEQLVTSEYKRLPGDRQGTFGDGKQSSEPSEQPAAVAVSHKAGADTSARIAEEPASSSLPASVSACNTDWSRTKDMIEQAISRPRPTEKLLSKPPFRFLHDIISEVIRVTGFAQGVFSESESDSSQVTEKGAKVAYLEKIIQYVESQVGISTGARAAKIVAGLEPESTNRFLQLLIVAASERRSSLSTDAAPDAKVAVTAPTRNIAEAEERRDSLRKPMAEDDFPVADVSAVEPEQGAGSLRSEEKKLIRPRTARARPPRVKDNSREVDSKESNTTAFRAPVVITQEGEASDEDDAERKPHPEMDGVSGAKQVSSSAAGHGKLVQDIMREQSEYEASQKMKGDGSSVLQTSETEGIRLGRLKRSAQEGKGSSNAIVYAEADIEQLRSFIQQICKATNPLGKCMDHIQEDVSTMIKEHDVWQAEYHRHHEGLEEQKAATEECVQSCRSQLLQIDTQVREQNGRLAAVKMTLSHNDERIASLLKSVVSGEDNHPVSSRK